MPTGRGTTTAAGQLLGREHDDHSGVALCFAGHEIVRLVPASGRIEARLVMPGINRSVDITASPQTVVRAVDEAAFRSCIPSTRALADLRRVIDRVVAESAAWRPSIEVPPVGRLGGASFPLLGAAYDNGAAPIGTLAPWSTGLLAAADARTAARLAFGEKATRPVIAAFAQSLLRAADGPVDLSRLALALIGRHVLSPDHLAPLLVAPGEAWPASSLPTPSQLADAQVVAGTWGEARTFAVLSEAAADDAGRSTFLACLRLAVELGPHAPRRLPNHLRELHDTYRLQVRTASEPLPNPAGAPRNRTPRSDPSALGGPGDGAVDTDDAVVDYGVYFPPPSNRNVRVTDATRIRHPAWISVVEHTRVQQFEFVLPHSCGDLVRWAGFLRICLDSFTAAAVSGASHLIGVEDDGRLSYVIEITPSRRIRQFTGSANRRPRRSVHDPIVSMLRSLGAVV